MSACTTYGRAGPRRGARRAGIDRHLAHPQEVLRLALGDLLEEREEHVPAGRIRGQEQHAQAPGSWGPERDAELLAVFANERIRDLNEDARAIAGLGIGGRGPAVLEVLEDRERLDDHVVARAALHPRDEAHAARVVLHRRAIEAMRLGLTAQLRERPHPRVIEHLVLHRDLFEVRPL
jgi:hypothetical protein